MADRSGAQALVVTMAAMFQQARQQGGDELAAALMLMHAVVVVVCEAAGVDPLDVAQRLAWLEGPITPGGKVARD